MTQTPNISNFRMILEISSGTAATISGLSTYSEIDEWLLKVAKWAEQQPVTFECWQDLYHAWQAIKQRRLTK